MSTNQHFGKGKTNKNSAKQEGICTNRLLCTLVCLSITPPEREQEMEKRVEYRWEKVIK